MRALLALLLLLAPAAAFCADGPAATGAQAAETQAVKAQAESGAPAAAAPKSERKLVEPYYAFQWNEGFIFPSEGKLFIGSNFGTTLGGQFTLSDQHAVFGVYDLRYNGPGLSSQEGRQFSERTIDHNFFAEHRWKFIPQHTLKTRAIYIKEMRRTAVSEVFGNGLYDFWVLGGMLADDYQLNPKVTLGLGVTYRSFQFPNYTDLLQEFQSAPVGAEVSGSQQDYDNLRIEASGRVSGIGRAWIAFSLQSYRNAKVTEETGEIGTKAQQESLVELGAAGFCMIMNGSESWPGKYYTTPSLRTYFKRSNQNYMQYDYLGDLSPNYVADNYSYNFLDLDLPVYWSFQSGWRIFFEPQWIHYEYISRPPRSQDGEYLWGRKQRNNTVLLSLGCSKQVGKFGAWTFGYRHHDQQSNTRFESLLPYNYTAETVFTSFTIQY